jgi:hypothetical protein
LTTVNTTRSNNDRGPVKTIRLFKMAKTAAVKLRSKAIISSRPFSWQQSWHCVDPWPD